MSDQPWVRAQYDRRQTCGCGHRYGDHATGGTKCMAASVDEMLRVEAAGAAASEVVSMTGGPVVLVGSAVCSAVEMEATTGFEPVNRGFADPCRTGVRDARRARRALPDRLAPSRSSAVCCAFCCGGSLHVNHLPTPETGAVSVAGACDAR